jgi:hypothetical protein
MLFGVSNILSITSNILPSTVEGTEEAMQIKQRIANNRDWSMMMMMMTMMNLNLISVVKVVVVAVVGRFCLFVLFLSCLICFFMSCGRVTLILILSSY